MTSVAAAKEKDISSTPARIDVVRTAPNSSEARMHLMDAFGTFEPIDLRALVDTVAETDARTKVRIQISPQPQEHVIWRSLKQAIESIQSSEAPARAQPDDNDDSNALHQEPPTAPGGDTVSTLDTRIFVVFQAIDNTCWFGSDGQGVYRFDGKTIVRFTTTHGLRGNRIRGIQQDRAGNILVNSDGGVSRFDGRGFRALNAVNTDPSKGEWRLNADDLWFTGWQDEGVVYRYEGTSLHRLAFPKTKPGEEHIAKYPRSQFPAMAYSPYDTYIIFKDSQGHLWFGTGTLGVCRYDGKSFAWASRDELDFSDEDGFGVRSIVESTDGTFWFSRTLHRFDVTPSSPAEQGNIALSYRKEPGISGARGVATDAFTHIISAEKDKNGDVWMATLDGSVWRYDGDSVTHYPVRDGNAVVTLCSIYKDTHDELWLGTHEHGVYKFNGKVFEQFSP